MSNYNLLYFDRSWLLISIWELAFNRITHFIQGVLTGIIDKLRHFSKTGDFVVKAKGLVQLATSTYGNSSAAHIVDPGTDCIVISAYASGANCTITGATLGSQAFTVLVTAYEATNGKRSAILYLKNPTIGTSTITIQYSGSVSFYATNWQGTQDSPFRTPTSTSLYGGSVSRSPISAVGDIIIDSLASSISTWISGAGQTTLHSGVLGVSKKAGATGTTTVSWTGSNAYLAYCAAALSGS